MASSCAQLSVQEQKIQIRRLMNKKRRKGDTWYLVATSWFNKWAEFVGFDLHWDEDNDSCDTSNVGNPSAHPGPIDNSGLMTSSGMLKDTVMHKQDYRLVSTEGWELFLSQYGIMEGQQPIERKVIGSMFGNESHVEIHLIDLKLCLGGKLDNPVIKSFSCEDTIWCIQKTMRRLFQISCEKRTQLWCKHMENTYQALDRLENTVRIAGLHKGQVIVIEVRNACGAWPWPFQRVKNPHERQRVLKSNFVKPRPAAVLSSEKLKNEETPVTSAANNSIEEMITCVICFDIMVSPHMLPCMHSFCEACLKKLDKVRKIGKEGFNCPTCREFATGKDTKKDFRVEQLIEVHQKSSGSAKKLKISQSNMCRKHPSCEVQAVCKQCNVEICSKCKFQNHDTHASQTIESAVENILPTVSEKIKLLTQKVDAMKSSLQAVENNNDKIKHIKEALLHDIHKQKEIGQKKLDAEFATLISDVSNLRGSVEKDVDSRSNLIKQSIEQVQSFITDVNNAMAETKDVKFYRSLQESDVKCDEMLKKNEDREFITPSDDEPLNVHFEPIEINLPLLGKLTNTSN